MIKKIQFFIDDVDVDVNDLKGMKNITNVLIRETITKEEAIKLGYIKPKEVDWWMI